METVDIIGLLVPATYFVFLVTERIWPARTFPPRKGWQRIGLGFTAGSVGAKPEARAS